MTARIPFAVVAIAGLGIGLQSAAAQRDRPAEHQPVIELQEVGDLPVQGSRTITINQPTVAFAGNAWNCQGGELVGLLKAGGETRWYAVGASNAEPGGTFTIAGVHFPTSGQFEIMVALFKPGAAKLGDSLDEDSVTRGAMSISNRVSVIAVRPSPADMPSIAPPALEDGKRPMQISIVSVGDISVEPQGITRVQASGDVLIATQGIPTPTLIYVAIHIPGTDKCYVYGPAKAEIGTLDYTVPGVSFDVPGNPLQLHLDLLAFATPRPVRPEPMSWESLRQEDFLVSRIVQIIAAWKPRVSDTLRVPFISITLVDDKPVIAEKLRETKTDRPESRLPVRQGGSVEVSLYDRLPESASLWILTSIRGSGLWLAQGPMIPRGDRTPAAIGNGQSPATRNIQTAQPRLLSATYQVTYVLPELRFESSRKEDNDVKDYEVMALASTAVYPNTWIPTTLLASRSIETVSQIVHVSVDRPMPTPDARLSISSISGTQVDQDTVLPVGANGSVVVEGTGDLPRVMSVYVCEHLVGGFTWSCTPTTRNGTTFTAADIAFTNPQAKDGSRCQLVAIATMGVLPLDRFAYTDFLAYATTASETISVEYKKSTFAVWRERVGSMLSDDDWANTLVLPQTTGSTTQGGWRMAMRMLPLVLLILGVLGLLLCLYLMERKFKTISTLSEDAAKALDEARRGVREKYGIVHAPDLPKFLLGSAILISVLYAIVHFYFKLYAHVVSDVTHMPSQESVGLAVWMLLLTALAGVFIHLSYREASESDRKSNRVLYTVLFIGLLAIALVLWCAQGAMYYTSLHHTNSEERLLPYLGGLMFFLIAIVETATFFFAMELTWGSVGWFVVTACCLVIGLISLPFHIVYRMFKPISATASTVAKKRDSPAESNTAQHEASNTDSSEKEKVA